ncbi:MAG: hypothetical protein LBC84_06015 [Prevotellaceae bacterium]|jgi:hypothetical protein|nr:hypothetical protein [Prevotellaceae bacterium]
MKNLLFFCTLSALLLWGCTPPDCFTGILKFANQQEEVYFDSDGGDQTIPITSLLAWKVISHPKWVTVSPMSGPGGVDDIDLTITAAENNTGAFRDGYVEVIDTGGNRLSIYVYQAAFVPVVVSLTVTPPTLFFAYNETTGTDNVTITTNQATWTTDTPPSWLTVSTTTGGTGSTTISVHPSSNNTGTTPRTATITVEAGGVTETFTVTQWIDLTTIPGGGTSFTNGRNYIGAFWKANETGERIIRNYNIAAADAGNWTAAVVWYDDRWNLSGGDGIVLSGATLTELTGRGIYGATPGDAEANPVTGSATIVSGTVATGGDIIFRIGLTKKFSDTGKFKADDPTSPANDANYTSTWPARYAVVLLSYSNNTKTQKIFIRQGEGADYVMRNGAPPAGDAFGPATGTGAPATRTQSVRFSPYNLTTHTEANLNTVSLGYQGGDFTIYPTQGGALFQWANSVNPTYAWNPVSATIVSGWNTSAPTTFWNTLSATHETCPPNYRRPNDGSTSGATGTTNNIAASEFRQSLWLNPQNGDDSNVANAVWGYYADGFFDRRSTGGFPAVSVAAGSNSIAYIGRLFYNSTTNASLFFPGAGRRHNDVSGTLNDNGGYGYYWSSSVVSDAWYLRVSQDGTAFLSWVNRAYGQSIRCVRNTP